MCGVLSFMPLPLFTINHRDLAGFLGQCGRPTKGDTVTEIFELTRSEIESGAQRIG